MTTLFPTSNDTAEIDESVSWPLRVWGLALLGAVSGLLIYWIARPDRYLPAHADLQGGASAFVAMGALLLAMLIERTRVSWSIGFAIIGGALVALATYWNGPFGSIEEPWKIACSALAVAIATPLFQAWRGAQAPETPLSRAMPYSQAYRHAWADVVLFVAACSFTAAFWTVAILLGQLFKLIGIRVLSDLLAEQWMILPLSGAALGAGIGLLRDHDQMLGLLQRVVTTILSVLAPLLASGLVIFLVAIPFTGLAPVWGATRSTSSVLLGCIMAALCLANAVIGEEKPSEAHNPLLRASVAGLAVSILPLALIAALSTALRIRQYGLTPDRLWASVFVAIACVYGVTYFFTIIRRQLNAAPYLRIANLRMALGLTVLALVLACPLLNFGAISTRDQVARLESGRTPLARFDWGALRFDFGRAGEAEVRRLAREGQTPEIRGAAAYALKQQDASGLTPGVDRPRWQPIDPKRLTILPRGATLPVELVDKLSDAHACSDYLTCLVRYDPERGEAIITTTQNTNLYRLEGGTWRHVDDFRVRDDAEIDRIGRGLKAGNMEVRQVPRRQVFVDGIPVGSDFE